MKLLTRAASRLRASFTRRAPPVPAASGVCRAEIEATIIRADGTVEHLGTIATMETS